MGKTNVIFVLFVVEIKEMESIQVQYLDLAMK